MRFGTPVHPQGGMRFGSSVYTALGISILNGPYEAYSGEVVTLRLDREPAAGATYAGLSVTLTNIIADGDDWLADLAIPDREANGLGVGYIHFIVVTAAADSTDEASTQNTLAPEPDIHVWHTVSGYDALEDQSDSIWWDGDDTGSYLAKDGDLGIVWNPFNLTNLTVTAAGIASADDFGDIERQLFDHESTQGVDGEYTEVGTVTVEEEGDIREGVASVNAVGTVTTVGEKVPYDIREGVASVGATASVTTTGKRVPGGRPHVTAKVHITTTGRRLGYLFGRIYRPATISNPTD